jgi:hypothetical protein
MVDPITAAIVGSALVGGLANYLGSKSAADRQKKAIREQNQLEIAKFERLQNLLNQVQDPTFDYRTLNPQDFTLVQEYVPEVASFVREKDPQFVELTQDAITGRQAQKDVLKDFMERSQGESLQSELNRQIVIEDTAQATRGLDESLIQEFSRRGQLGSGLEAAMRLVGREQTTGNLADLQAQLAAQAEQEQLQALAQAGNIGGQIEQSEISREAKNTDIINAFNQRLSARQQQQEMYEADTKNQAQLRNIGERQRINEMNIAQKNQTEQQRIDNRNRIAQQEYQNQMNRVNAMTGIQPNQMSPLVAQQPSNWQLLEKLAQAGTAGGMYAANQQNKEAARQSSYERELDKYAAEENV